MMVPPTIVAIPENPYDSFILDVNYVDFSGVLDIPNGYPVAPCYVVPPYKPLVYTVLHSNSNVTVLAYRGMAILFFIVSCFHVQHVYYCYLID